MPSVARQFAHCSRQSLRARHSPKYWARVSVERTVCRHVRHVLFRTVLTARHTRSGPPAMYAMSEWSLCDCSASGRAATWSFIGPRRQFDFQPSITATSVEAALKTIQDANSSGAEILELRLDFYRDFDPQEHLAQLTEACRLPYIVTYRPTWEGGHYDGDEEQRLCTLREAADRGAPYVDIELDAAEAFGATAAGSSARLGMPQGTQLILSHHNFETTLSLDELRQKDMQMRRHGADITKLAMTATDICDSWIMLQLLQNRTGPMIALSMGERGVITRILASKYGGFLTFGALRSGQESAPGQPTIQELQQLYKCKHLTAATQVLGVIGRPVQHSRSPALHNAAMTDAGFDGVYVPLLVDDLGKFLMTFSAPDWRGFSVTIPHKEEACRLSSPDDVAAKIGAVNTLVRQSDAGFTGHNTDWDAAISAVESELRKHNPNVEHPLADKTVTVLGAGGAARALAFGAAERGAAKVTIAARSETKAAALKEQVQRAASCIIAHASLADLQRGAVPPGDVILNSTPLGMVGDREHETPVPLAVLQEHQPLVFDAVYTPLQTRLLAEAREAGCVTVSGLEMFVGQAAVQFEYFTGLEPPLETMRDVVVSSLGS